MANHLSAITAKFSSIYDAIIVQCFHNLLLGCLIILFLMQKKQKIYVFLLMIRRICIQRIYFPFPRLLTQASISIYVSIIEIFFTCPNMSLSWAQAKLFVERCTQKNSNLSANWHK